jgi:hypothetical protein
MKRTKWGWPQLYSLTKNHFPYAEKRGAMHNSN